jgi:hypothetical protein
MTWFSMSFQASVVIRLWIVEKVLRIPSNQIYQIVHLEPGPPTRVTLQSASGAPLVITVPTKGRVATLAEVTEALNAPFEPRVHFAKTVLDGWACILPARIRNEDLGDYIEDINRRIADGQGWRAYIRVVIAILDTGMNTYAYVVSLLKGRRSPARK